MFEGACFVFSTLFTDLKLHSSHSSTDQEDVSLVDRSVGLQEIGLEVDIKQVASDALHSVVNGQDVDPLAVFHIRECRHAKLWQNRRRKSV